MSITPTRAEDFVASIGVNVHLSYFNTVYGTGYRTIILPRLQELGIRHLRDVATWMPSSVGNDPWMNRTYDAWREVALLTGAKFTAIVDPKRALNQTPAHDYADMTHVLDLLSRIGSANLAAWEGINEHDNSGRPGWAAELIQAQTALYAQTWPTAIPTIGPSLAFATTNAAAVGDISGYMDRGNIHMYEGGQPPGTGALATIVAARTMSATLTQQATETGYHTAPNSVVVGNFPITELAHAKYTLRQLLEHWNYGLERSFIYEFINEDLVTPGTTDPANIEHNFGLLRVDGTPKAAFIGLRNMISLLGERGVPSYALLPLNVTISGDSGVSYTLLQKSNRRYYLVLWQSVASYDSVTLRDLVPTLKYVDLTFAWAPTKVVSYMPLIDMVPRSIAYNTHTTSVAVPVPDHPVILEIIR